MTTRIDLDERGGIDDVHIDDVSTFRLERMSNDLFWCCVYVEGKRHVFWIGGDHVRVTHQEETT